MTVSEAFQIFKSELELPERKQKEAAAAQQAIRVKVSEFLSIETSFLTGSYARHTKIDPLADIDVFLVRNKQRTTVSTDGSGILPAAALDELSNAARRAYPLTAVVKKQNRSVNVQVDGLPFGFDLTPAWLRQSDGYWIPDGDSGTWIPSDPDAHAAKMTVANESNGGKLKPVIKMVKHWSRNNYDLLRSFHIELICADIFLTENLDNYQLGVATVLVHLPKYVGQRMMDPVYGQCRVDKELNATEAKQMLARANYDGGNAIEAIKLERAARDGEAIAKWAYIFGTGFPR